MAARATPERFSAAVKRALKDEPEQVRLVRFPDDGSEPEECDQGDIARRPGRFELQRKGEAILWCDSKADGEDDSREKAIASEIRQQGNFYGHHLAMYAEEQKRRIEREVSLEKRIEELRDENERMRIKLAAEIAEGGPGEEWIPLIQQVVIRVFDMKFTNELHKRLNRCKFMTKEELAVVAKVITSEEFTKQEEELISAPAGAPRLQ